MAKTHRHDDEIRVDDLDILKEWSILGVDVLATAAELNALDGLTSTVDELNILDGVLADFGEINILNGALLDVNELNILNGATLDVNELNTLTGITSIVEELNLLDNQVAGATIVVGTEVPDVINVTIQFTDALGADMATPVSVRWYLADDAAGLDPATVAHSAGAAIGVDGALIESVANLSGMMISEADGDVDIDFTEAGTLTKYLVLVMPNGSFIISDAITHAA